MGRLILFLKNYPEYLYYFAFLLIFPALFINLGLMPLLADEATRATVALEMILSGNYILPTIGGENYYNKPPLFNWILSGLFQLTHHYSEMIVRLSAAIPLLIFAVIIYLSVKKYTGKQTALFSAFAMITFARMLFYDSMLGHIDILFSLITFLSFIALYHYYSRKKILQLFLVTYALTTVGFLMKGLPSLAFQAISLLVLFISHKDYKPLFGYKHAAGIFLFVCLSGTYYFILSQYISIDIYYQTLITESGKRTITDKGILNNIIYIFQFPFEQLLFHLFPWGLLIVFCFNKHAWKHISANPFLRFVFWILIFNVIIYWISPETRPRYLFMLYPLIFILLFDLYFKLREHYKKLTIAFDTLLLSVACLSCLLVLYLPFFDFRKTVIDYFFLKWVILSVFIFLVTYLLFLIKEHRFILFIICLLFIRLTFDLFILPERFYNGKEKLYREQIRQIATLTKNDSLYIHKNVCLKHSEHYYLDLERKSIPPRIDTLHYKKGFMLIDSKTRYPRHIQVLDSFQVEWLDQKIYLIKSNENIIRSSNGSE
jgi:4-amino-4-deoxy-L-arabinose transferase-like glycosyltransferase